jgi:hypothetical protein
MPENDTGVGRCKMRMQCVRRNSCINLYVNSSRNEFEAWEPVRTKHVCGSFARGGASISTGMQHAWLTTALAQKRDSNIVIVFGMKDATSLSCEGRDKRCYQQADDVGLERRFSGHKAVHCSSHLGRRSNGQ